MTLVQFFRIFARFFPLMMLAGIIMGGLVFWKTMDEVRTYTTSGLVHTGIYSGYNLESNGNSRLDYHQASAELDNLLNIATSFETYEELGQRLLAECLLLDEPNGKLISARAFRELHEAIPDSIWKNVRVDGDAEATYQKIVAYCQRGDDNPIYLLLYSKNKLFGVDHFSSIKIKTDGKSDMLRETYTTTDPGIGKRTLELHIQIYSDKQQDMKRLQSKDVVEYFRKQLGQTRNSLRGAEDSLTNYMRSNRIINYYEQTRFIAAKREDLLELEFRQFMELQSADSTLKALENQMASRVSLGQLNRELGNLRDSLAEVSAELTRLEWLSPRDSNATRNVGRIDYLQQAAQRLRNRILTAGDSIYRTQVTPRGSDLDAILFQWLRNLMLKSEAQAKLAVVDIRKKEFDQIYQRMAPIGSEIKRMERLNHVYEQSYLENLHSLNTAVMHQQNMMLSASLTMISKPYFPSRPDPSSRKFLIVAAFLAGFILTLGLVVALEYFDNTLRTPVNAEEIVGLRLIGALPRFPQLPKMGPSTEAEPEEGKKKKKKSTKVNYEYVEDRTIGLLLQNLKIDLTQRNASKPIRVAIISMRPKEGKSLLASMLTERLRNYNERVLLLTPEPDPLEEEIDPQKKEKAEKKKQKKGDEPERPTIPEHPDTHPFPVPPWFYDVKDEATLVSAEQFDGADKFDTLITELPPLLMKPYPVHLIDQADMVLLVCRANRVWSKADTNTLLKLQETTHREIRLVLNGTGVDHLEPIMGYVPKKRSIFRRLAKRMVSRSFQESGSI